MRHDKISAVIAAMFPEVTEPFIEARAATMLALDRDALALRKLSAELARRIPDIRESCDIILLLKAEAKRRFEERKESE